MTPPRGTVERVGLHCHAADVGELMTTPVISVGPDESHVDAAGLMKRKHVKRLPVLDDSGRLLGVVSRSDMVDGVWSVESDVRFLVDDTQRHDETRPFGVPRPNW